MSKTQDLPNYDKFENEDNDNDELVLKDGNDEAENPFVTPKAELEEEEESKKKADERKSDYFDYFVAIWNFFEHMKRKNKTLFLTIQIILCAIIVLFVLFFCCFCALVMIGILLAIIPIVMLLLKIRPKK